MVVPRALKICFATGFGIDCQAWDNGLRGIGRMHSPAMKMLIQSHHSPLARMFPGSLKI